MATAFDHALARFISECPYIAPHHPEVSYFPHHVHQADGEVISSALTGNPEVDLGEVRREIERLLAR
ncbi:MAG: hypothetical protein QMD04_04055 [Anaerolineales bacterium]|nr:hypothetical protein [Anaerolineales bacterium]